MCLFLRRTNEEAICFMSVIVLFSVFFKEQLSIRVSAAAALKHISFRSTPTILVYNIINSALSFLQYE